MSDLYTCITCRVAFHEGDAQRQHYKTDWHRYNLKRKVAELPPVTAEEFNNRVIAQRNDATEKTKDKSKYCDCCRKSFNNENSYENHLPSRKHKENEVRKFEEDILSKLNPPALKEAPGAPGLPEDDAESDVESVDSDEWADGDNNPVQENVCLFCNHKSRSVVRNLRHMSLQHSFFIPDAEYCTDVPGLLNYLGEKVYNGFMCLWCNETGKAFHSVEACQTHMRDQGHTKILHEGDVVLEYADFYDYSSSYPEGEQTPNIDLDEEISLPTLDGSDYQLVLPSGAVIGHRSLVRYYKQNMNPNSQIVPVPKTKSGRTLVKVLAQYRALGYVETKKECVLKKARDIHFMHRVQQKWKTKLSFKANKMQHHFRQQVLF